MIGTQSAFPRNETPNSKTAVRRNGGKYSVGLSSDWVSKAADSLFSPRCHRPSRIHKLCTDLCICLHAVLNQQNFCREKLGPHCRPRVVRTWPVASVAPHVG